jgi:hypothetical protein
VSCGRRHECNVSCSGSIELNGKARDVYTIGIEGESQMFHAKGVNYVNQEQ